MDRYNDIEIISRKIGELGLINLAYGAIVLYENVCGWSLPFFRGNSPMDGFLYYIIYVCRSII